MTGGAVVLVWNVLQMVVVVVSVVLYWMVGCMVSPVSARRR